MVKLRADKQLMALTGKDFWQLWERKYLTGQLSDVRKLKENVADIYESLKHHYPGFSL